MPPVNFVYSFSFTETKIHKIFSLLTQFVYRRNRYQEHQFLKMRLAWSILFTVFCNNAAEQVTEVWPPDSVDHNPTPSAVRTPLNGKHLRLITLSPVKDFPLAFYLLLIT